MSDSTLVGEMQALAASWSCSGLAAAVSLRRDGLRPRGGLLSLGPDLSAIGRGAADYIDRILKGAEVAELPVVLPSKFVLT